MLDMWGYVPIYVCVCGWMHMLYIYMSQLCPLKGTRSNGKLAAMAIPADISWLLNMSPLKGTKVPLEKWLIPSLGLREYKVFFPCKWSSVDN